MNVLNAHGPVISWVSVASEVFSNAESSQDGEWTTPAKNPAPCRIHNKEFKSGCASSHTI